MSVEAEENKNSPSKALIFSFLLPPLGLYYQYRFYQDEFNDVNDHSDFIKIDFGIKRIAQRINYILAIGMSVILTLLGFVPGIFFAFFVFFWSYMHVQCDKDRILLLWCSPGCWLSLLSLICPESCEKCCNPRVNPVENAAEIVTKAFLDDEEESP